MRVLQNDGSRLVLEGNPHARGMLLAFVVCVVMVTGTGWFTARAWTRSGSVWDVVGPAAGLAISLFLSAAVIGFSLRRERLTIDKVSKSVTHRTWSVVFGRARERAYPRERVHGVAVQRTMQSPGGGKGFPTRVTTARLLLTKPRKGIELDEVQGGDPAPVIALAGEVAAFLGVPVTELGGHED